MNVFRSTVLAVLSLPLLAAPALAQSSNQPIRGYVAGLLGAVSGPPTESAFGVQWGENMGRWAQAYVDLSYFNNLLPSATRDQLTALGPVLTATTQGLQPSSTTTFSFSGKDRGVTFTGGGKFLVPIGIVQPYVGGGGGIIGLKREIVEPHLGDVTQAVFNDFQIGDAELLTGENVTKPVGEFTAGVNLVFKHTYVDAGYRYRHVFGLTDYNFSSFTGGVGYKW